MKISKSIWASVSLVKEHIQKITINEITELSSFI